MDPLSPILAALIAGSAAALQSTVGEVVKDGYAALKRILSTRYSGVDVTPVERDPGAPESRRAVERQLRDAGAAADTELLVQAKKLLEEVERHEPALAKVIGADLQKIKAGNIRIEDIVSAGSGVRIKEAEAAGDFVISGVRAGGGGGHRPGKR